MTPCPNHPILYEINTWAWLNDLSRRCGKEVTLANLPEDECESLASLGVDAVWLMGIWERSPEGRQISFNHAGLLAEFRQALPDYTPEDNLGSAYCIHRYVVDERLGGNAGLDAARGQLARYGIRVILDFVPNHTARDHPWVLANPDNYIQTDMQAYQAHPHEHFIAGGRVLACGRDPNFPAWEDTAQVNAFSPSYRRAAMDTLAELAGMCDGVRCDMAMLLLDRIFSTTWGQRAGHPLPQPFWRQLISATREVSPDFLFIAEAYWDTEPELLAEGFSYCYDKNLYDLLSHRDAHAIEQYLHMDNRRLNSSLRFIENHDEKRAAVAFPDAKYAAATAVLATLPGARMFHQGQFEGRKVRLPVFLRRWPVESVNPATVSLYRALLPVATSPAIRSGEWHLCRHHGWPDNHSHTSLLTWAWWNQDDLLITVINYSGFSAQGYVTLPLQLPSGSEWKLQDITYGDLGIKPADELTVSGLFVDLRPWDYHLVRCTRV